MKTLLGIAALILAFSPLAQAQNTGAGLAGHPDARNDRQMESPAHRTAAPRLKHLHHAKHHPVTHHHDSHHHKHHPVMPHRHVHHTR
jgi:hypothetical protein